MEFFIAEAFSTPHSHPYWAQILVSGSCFQIPLACIPPLMRPCFTTIIIITTKINMYSSLQYLDEDMRVGLSELGWLGRWLTTLSAGSLHAIRTPGGRVVVIRAAVICISPCRQPLPLLHTGPIPRTPAYLTLFTPDLQPRVVNKMFPLLFIMFPIFHWPIVARIPNLFFFLLLPIIDEINSRPKSN